MDQEKTVQRYMAIVAYDGQCYSGFQIQPDARTIQGELQRVLRNMHKRDISIVGSGRTDAGVHAKGQVFHFDSELTLTEEQWPKAFNSQLKQDIRVQRVQRVNPDFHARYHVKRKEYRYYLYRSETINPFKRHYAIPLHPNVDIERMREAAKCLIGTHDFTSFSSAQTEVEDKTRTIYRLELEQYGEDVTVICEGNGFLYNMVRIIVGTLIEVGQGKLKTEDITRALREKDRSLTGKTAPANGLFLWHVTYPTTSYIVQEKRGESYK